MGSSRRCSWTRLDTDLGERRVRRLVLVAIEALEATFVEHEGGGLLVGVAAALDADADRNFEQAAMMASTSAFCTTLVLVWR